ncbi:MAG: ATP-binding protein [Acidobacteria bacterium]|nr:ATP-binding protein [Acidobacteriota bacterium]
MSFDFADIRGQAQAKRALEVAAAGGHHVLMIGQPNAGRFFLARRIPGILPPLSGAEAAETAEIFAAAGLLKSGGDPDSLRRPFRAPHHTVSRAGMAGGGPVPRPGEASLAHNGVLFLDELPEFQRGVLEALRGIMKVGESRVYRGGQVRAFPARFLLVAASNPCPCGYFGEARCRCSAEAILRYSERVRAVEGFDLVVRVPPLHYADLRQREGEPSAAIRERVLAARAFAVERRGEAQPPGATVARVARTIADLAGSREVLPEHRSEAQALVNPF